MTKQVTTDQVPAYTPVDPGTNRMHSWAEFRAAGMLWVANRMLHLFGWAIVVAEDDDGTVSAFPVRTEWRGFPDASEFAGFTRVGHWMRESADAVLGETLRDPVLCDGPVDIEDDDADGGDAMSRPFNVVIDDGDIPF